MVLINFLTEEDVSEAKAGDTRFGSGNQTTEPVRTQLPNFVFLSSLHLSTISHSQA